MTTLLDRTVSLLRQLPLLADVPEADLARLAETCHLTQAPRDAMLFEQGDPCDRVFIVQSGRVKIVYQEEDGREVILEMIAPGEAFGGAVLFFPTHPATAKAMEDSEVVSFSNEAYASFLLAHPAVALKLIRMLGQRHRSMINLQILAGERVERRIAHILLKLGDRCGQPQPEGTLITLPLSRQDLADMSGTTLETAIRTISRFNTQGLLRTERGGYLLILNEPRLRDIAQSGM